MENDTIKMIQDIKNVENPNMKAIKLSWYVTDLLKKDVLTIYEAYLLHGEILKYKREWYRLPAWNGRVQISNCLEIINQRLLAIAFGESEYAEALKEWGREAFRLCREKRTHYIMDRFEEFINMDEDEEALLQELLDVRKKYTKLSFNKGPYHVEVFPHHYLEPEKILLDKRDLSAEKVLSKYIETVLAELRI